MDYCQLSPSHLIMRVETTLFSGGRIHLPHCTCLLASAHLRQSEPSDLLLHLVWFSCSHSIWELKPLVCLYCGSWNPNLWGRWGDGFRISASPPPHCAPSYRTDPCWTWVTTRAPDLRWTVCSVRAWRDTMKPWRRKEKWIFYQSQRRNTSWKIGEMATRVWFTFFMFLKIRSLVFRF